MSNLQSSRHNSAHSAGVSMDSSGPTLSPTTTVGPTPYTGNALMHTVSASDQDRKPHTSYLYPLSKSKTHQGSGTYEGQADNTKTVPAYKTVHLDNVIDEFKPLDPKTVLHMEKKPHLAKNNSSVPFRTTANYKRRVSFDTVNLQIADDDDSYGDDDCDDVGLMQGRDRWSRREQLLSSGGWGPFSGSEPSPGSSYLASRGRSPHRDISPHQSLRANSSERSLSPGNPFMKRMGSVSPIRNISIAGAMTSRQYPTSPIITHDACTLTKKHKDFDKLYSRQLGSRRPLLPDRNIMCYISGRKHTWVALDWCCNRLLEDGDSMVVTAAINPSSRSLFVRRLSSSSNQSREASEEYIRNSPEYAKVVTENIMKYIMAILNPNKILKITIELAVGGTKDVLKDMYSLYLPSLVVVAAKPTKAASTRSWVTSRVTDRLVKNFHVPVVIVPSLNMDLFEEKLFTVLNKRMDELHHNYDDPNFVAELEDVGSYKLSDHESAIASQKETEESNTDSPAGELKRLQHLTSMRIYQELSDILKRSDDENKYKDWLKVISAAAYNYGVNLAESAKSGGESAQLVRTLTGAPDPMYGRSRSMLLDIDTSPQPKSPQEGKIPAIHIHSSGDNSGPRQQTSLKFDISHPKYYSQDSSTSLKLDPLRPTVSTPQLRPQKSSDSSEKEKKGFFRSLFRRK
ncbi:hypothetical protein KL925_004634 [Ogataea polymorpha]|uniref:uncharacterized protein n=1 Tax=Ogataea polymorpha TaxID=460523 RepID=UPI0007F3C627|nr:uncharacterized protein OGAPODRAFT_96054 [Ogataea polymorpha]KAG7878052.1 hypothetical protein KL937_004199 [Ogataea polymorpha]KAG7887283.1 hypothetical protein KL936_004443 [Ogataea polymorpha]KAG7896523.1 hypothetical protein KL908_001037 [Ogataea polymorpha]KAG7898298.1 hypothetical protein KL935_004448 [Ogataea polymorpha]KAG7906372.1 hypothetical protein KL906_004464 [Ogataea polymorpha]